MSDDLLHDPRITEYGLLLEVLATLNARLTADIEETVGIPHSWFEVLLRIGRTPGQAMRMTRLAEAVSFSSGGFSRLADRMEQAGLIGREPDPHDRRATVVRITGHGAAVLRASLAVHVPGLQRYFIGYLTPEQRMMLEAILRHLRSSLSQTNSSLAHG